MVVDTGAPFGLRVEQALQDQSLRVALDRATERLVTRRAESMAAIDSAALRLAARRTREFALANLPQLLEQLESNLIANGCQVHWADDAAAAQSLLLEIAQRGNARLVVKSKSMVSEEIGLNGALERCGIEVVETDLGEYIVQLAGEPPSHILAPVIHKRLEEISELFQRRLAMPPTNDPADLCATARRQLREKFLRADIGISGCNFAIAETGTICLVTNEGNGRMVSSLPPIYVVVAGIEKVVATVEDAVLLWQAVSRSATGQDVSVYLSLSSGPRRLGQPDGPREMHVILLDNGRSRILERGYAEALLCIRCGACLNACPVYREIGGHTYGKTPYSGPIGAVITPLLADDPASWAELPSASSLCGACREVCPVKIDIPRLLLDLRSDILKLRRPHVLERLAIRSFAKTMARPSRYRLAARLARGFTRVLSRRKGREISRLPPPFDAWTRGRVFPAFAERGFRKLWSERLRSSQSKSER